MPARRSSHAQSTRLTRERILTAFSERAKQSGLRGVVMGELASELRMSATTLYAHFASKEALVEAMVDHWCAELASHEAIVDDPKLSIVERFMVWTDAWSERVVRYSPTFWSDLARDYPRQWEKLQRDLAKRRAKGEGLLRRHIRKGLVPEIAFALLDEIYAHAHDPRLADRLGIARRDAVRTQLEIWARGALSNESNKRH